LVSGFRRSENDGGANDTAVTTVDTPIPELEDPSSVTTVERKTRTRSRWKWCFGGRGRRGSPKVSNSAFVAPPAAAQLESSPAAELSGHEALRNTTPIEVRRKEAAHSNTVARGNAELEGDTAVAPPPLELGGERREPQVGSEDRTDSGSSRVVKAVSQVDVELR
jgi:hypothetical protein